MSLLDGLQAYYKLDGNANDELGNYNGTPSNVSWVAGKIGQAGSFNGSNSRINFSSNPINGAVPYSISFWVYFSGDITSDNFIIQQRDYGGITGQYNILVNDNKINAWEHQNGYTYQLESSELSKNIWNHIVLTRNTNSVKLYLNGQLDRSSNPGGLINITRTFAIGYDHRDGDKYLKGLIDEVGIWSNRELLLPEAIKLYNNGKGLTYPFLTGVNNIFIGGKKVADIRLGSRQIKEVYKGDKLIFKV